MRTVLRVALPSTIVGALVGLARFTQRAQSRVFSDVVSGGDPPAWLIPDGMTIGTTVVAYSRSSDLVLFLTSLVLVAGIGYSIGRRVDVAASVPELLGGFAIGAIVGIGSGGIVAEGAMLALDAPDRWIPSVPLVPGAELVLEFVLIAFAGASLAHFGAFEEFSRSRRWIDSPDTVHWLALVPVVLIVVEVLGTLAVLLWIFL